MSLLPPNATDFEKALEHVTRFEADAGLLNGFKFKWNPQVISYLIWEYDLNDVLEYIKICQHCLSSGIGH